MNTQKNLNKVRARRKMRSRARISGTKKRPRLAVFRSNAALYAQLIDDESGRTLVSASTRHVKSSGTKIAKSAAAREAGKILAAKAKEAGITKATFDRRGYKYHGRVRALAEGAREGGLKI
jgi:large subunit ribosomal protein L18